MHGAGSIGWRANSSPDTMSATPPTEISIGGRTLSVRVEPGLEPWGEYRGDEGVIALSPRALGKSSSLRETLRHEMLHAALDISGISYLERFEEEAVVRCIDNIFHPAWDVVRRKLTTLE